MKKIAYSVLVILSAVYFSACSDMNDLHKEFIVPGGITYPQKAEALTILEGRNRVRLQWLRGSDPKVVKARVYWNNYTDSVNVDIPAADNVISVDINNLAEDSYTFFVKTYDAEGHVSVPVEVSGQTYGEIYQSSLSSRALESLSFFPDRAELTWKSADNAAISFVLKYYNSLGELREQIIPLDEQITSLTDYQLGSDFTTETRYRPTPTALDEFFAADEQTFPSVLKLTKSTWDIEKLPTDSWEGASGATGPEWILENLWDGVEASSTNLQSYASNNAPIPQWFTIDLGYTASLSRMQLWPHSGYIYTWMAPRKFELWGSNNPDTDGGWTNWVLLGTWEAHKPSGYGTGGAVGTITADDTDYFINNQVYEISPSAATPNAADPVRYIRFKTLENFTLPLPANDYVAFGEMALWGEYR